MSDYFTPLTLCHDQLFLITLPSSAKTSLLNLYKILQTVMRVIYLYFCLCLCDWVFLHLPTSVTVACLRMWLFCSVPFVGCGQLLHLLV